MWDKTKAYKNNKLGENDLMFEKKKNFFTFLFLCQNLESLSSFNQLGVIFSFLFICANIIYIILSIILCCFHWVLESKKCLYIVRK